MAGECRQKRIKNDCGGVSVGDGVITFTYGVGPQVSCGDEIGQISMDQCENETINIPCPGNGKLIVKHCDGTYTYRANQDGDLEIDLGCPPDKWENFPICDECWTWVPGKSKQADCVDCYEGGPSRAAKSVESRPESVATGDPAARTLKLVKFWSKNCGICHRMSHYDSKVAKELGIEFISVNKNDAEAWSQWVYVAESLYSNPKTMGWPTYILVDHESRENFVTKGEVIGGSHKGKFRSNLQELIDDKSEQPVPYNPLGGDKQSHCKPFDDKDCSPFRWDCTEDKVRICHGAKGHIEMKVSTHGCNSRCGDPGEDGGKDLGYEWRFSKDNNTFRAFDPPIGKSTFDFKLDMIPGADKLEAGDKVWLRAIATCDDHKNNKRITGGGGANGGQDIKIEIVDCCGGDSVCPEGKTCCNKTDHPDQPEGCQTCCKNRHCPTGKICKNGKCVDDVECTKDSDCGTGKCCKGDNTCGDCPDCTKNSDCSSNKCEECNNNGKCKSKCAADKYCDGKGNCVDCLNDNHCGNGKCCQGNKCVDCAAPPDPDPEPEECEEGGWVIDYACVLEKLGLARSADDEALIANLTKTVEQLSDRIAALERD